MTAERVRDEPGATILHISDPQFGDEHRFETGALARYLIDDLRKLRTDGVGSIDLIIISGDIAETGKAAEFDEAKAFIDALCAETGLDHERVIVVPGNHDISRAACAAYFSDCESDDIPPEEPYARKWRHYQAFATWLHGATAFTADQPYRVHRFDDLRLVVAAMNSTMRESHRDDDHYGWCGERQLRWFAEQLEPLDSYARIGVLHHNARRKADLDDENLRDEEDVTRWVGPYLDVLLHGHTHDGKKDHLSDGTLVLATGSAAVKEKRRPQDVPNQYQILRLRPDGLTRWARQWDGKGQWIADSRISDSGNDWIVDIDLRPIGWQRAPELYDTVQFLATPPDFAVSVRGVTEQDLGPEAQTDVRTQEGLSYVVATRTAAPLRCVGAVDGPLDQGLVDRFDSTIFAPLRQRGNAEFYIVHCGTDDPELRRAASRRGIRLKTWTEYNDLLDASAYRQWLHTQLAVDPLYPQELYLPQRFRNIDRFGKERPDVRPDLLSQVYDHILDEEGRFLLILGEAGYGKSFLVRRLAYTMLSNPEINITPIVIYLRDFDKRQTIDEMAYGALRDSDLSFNQKRFAHSLQAGTLALLIDGYDEFAVRVGYKSAASQLQTFIDALRGRAKVLLTTRPNHFRSNDEVTSALFDRLRSVHHGAVYQLQPFDSGQQRTFLTRWFSLAGVAEPAATADAWMAALGRVDNLPELAQSPRMLSFMAKDLPLVDIEGAASEGTVTAANLYQRLLDQWLAEESSRLDREDRRRVPPGDRQRVLETLALTLWLRGERDATEELFQEVVREGLDLVRLDLTADQATQLVGGRTMLTVANRRWRFAHQSVWEYLLANRIAALLRAGDVDRLRDARLTDLTIRFLRDIAPDEAIEWARRIAEDDT